MNEKIAWQGTLVSVQPRIRLTRSFDQRNHSYLGYALRVQGILDGDKREFTVGIGKAVHVKHQFRAGDIVKGMAQPVADENRPVIDAPPHEVPGGAVPEPPQEHGEHEIAVGPARGSPVAPE